MAPCGPAITPSKFVKDPNSLRIQLYVNDEKMMDGSTSQMIYKIDEQLSIISNFITLQPGDILFTGSPSGSAREHGDGGLSRRSNPRRDLGRRVLNVTIATGLMSQRTRSSETRSVEGGKHDSIESKRRILCRKQSLPLHRK